MTMATYDKYPAVSVPGYSCTTGWSAIANQIQSVHDIEPVLEKAGNIPGLRGIVAILEEKLGLWGKMNLIKLDN